MGSDDQAPDYGLISPLAVPADSRIPNGSTGGSGPAEYDQYFRIVRDHPGLLEWTRTCLRIEVELLDDLKQTSLSFEDRSRLLEGLLSVHRVTLERWLAAAEAATGSRPDDDTTENTTENTAADREEQ